MVLEGGDFPMRGAPLGPIRKRGRLCGLWSHMGDCARKRGAFDAYRSVSYAYDPWGRPCAKEGRLMKAMGRLHRRTVELPCGIKVTRKVMALR